MDILNQLLSSLTNLADDPEAIQLGFAALLGLTVFALMIAVLMLIMGFTDPMRRRLRGLEPSTAESTGGASGGTTSPPSPSAWQQVLGPMGERLLPAEQAKRQRAAERLRHAGIRRSGALSTFYGARLALTVLPPLLLLALVVPFVRLAPQLSLLMVVASAMVGYLLPGFWLERKVRQRTQQLRRALPDALDLLVVCAEAGLGLTMAIQRVARDLEVSHPELAEEFQLFGMQIRAGLDQRGALRDLEERTGVDDIRGLVTTLLQSMRFGTSIAATLRLFAVELRDKRTQEAEEKAAKVSTKMLFPLIFCVFPSFFVVALGPPLLGAMAALAGTGR